MKRFAELLDGVVAFGIRFHDVFAKSCRVGSGTPPGYLRLPDLPADGHGQSKGGRADASPWWRRAKRALP